MQRVDELAEEKRHLLSVSKVCGSAVVELKESFQHSTAAHWAFGWISNDKLANIPSLSLEAAVTLGHKFWRMLTCTEFPNNLMARTLAI